MKQIKKKKRQSGKYILIIPSVLIGIIFTFFYISYSNKPNIQDMSIIQQQISTKIVRFHVLANSDSDADQQLKLKVKEAVVTYIAPILQNSSSIDESKELLLKNEETIKKIANDIIQENGYDYCVTTSLCTTYFPTKSYGKFTFPPGDYEAYQIKIGNAKGQNWWCVLYPPLCFIDISHGVVDNSSDEMLHSILTTDEYNAIAGTSKVKYRFKYLTFLNKYIN